MGCDIHMYVERKIKNSWFSCDYFVPSVQYRGSSEYNNIPIYDGRNYALFATLANVRNYGHTAYISEPKGIPEDACNYIKEEYEDWIWDAHSASYLTLQELIDFHEAGHPLKRRGMLSPEQQKELDSGILPEHWCQGCNISGYEVREWEEESNILVPLINRLKDRMNELNMTYDFYWDSENEESRKKAYEAAANIRIVFWFDN